MIKGILALLPLLAIAIVIVVLGQGAGPEDLPQPLLQAEEAPPPQGFAVDVSLLGEGWEEAFEPETFGPDELYAKIDGGADVYLAHGFKQLRVHSFLHAASGDYVEVFLFDQGDQAQAMYELEKPVDSAEDPEFSGYFAGASLFAVWDTQYVQIQAASDTPRTREAVRALGRRLRELPS